MVTRKLRIWLVPIKRSVQLVVSDCTWQKMLERKGMEIKNVSWNMYLFMVNQFFNDVIVCIYVTF